MTHSAWSWASDHREGFESVPDAPDTDKPAAVATQPNDLNATAGMRCVDHASTPQVNADVTQAENDNSHSSLLSAVGDASRSIREP